MRKNCKCNPFCSLLDTNIRKQLCEHAIITYQEPKQIQFYQGNEQLEIISDGVLVTFTFLEDGSQKAIELVQEGDILGTHLLSRHIDYPNYHTMSLTQVKVCNLPFKVIKTLFDGERQFAQVLLQYISQRHAKNSIFWMTIYSKNSEEKVKYIYELLQGNNVDMNRITQEDLAMIAGVSRISVARAMKIIYKQT
ncbi:MAG: Crp/Fnr family transcriptional regulator [Clostridia bacterium]|nr:Crp/Fnr family transcriptional regulator [Clostridia bacterium]